MNDPLRAIWGALIGDACGATLEGLGTEISADQAKEAMSMKGGGRLRVGPGQITDDGELTLALWSVLKNHDIGEPFPMMDTAKAYVAWYDSMPFDIGGTCSLAFEQLQESLETDDTINGLYSAVSQIHDMNFHSEANGAMMRATPIATVYASRPSRWAVSWVAHHAAMAALQEGRLSHSGTVARESNAMYVYALTLLLKGCTPAETILHVESYVQTQCHTVRQWLYDSKGEWMSWGSARNSIGHVKHAFTMAFWFLRRPDLSYEHAIWRVLKEGGDTDTNAAIVGGMVACYQPIPLEMKRIVHSFDSTTVTGRIGHQRPATYCPKYHLPM